MKKNTETPYIKKESAPIDLFHNSECYMPDFGQPQGIAPTCAAFVGAIPCGCPLQYICNLNYERGPIKAFSRFF
jgi:hypothetical protein